MVDKNMQKHPDLIEPLQPIKRGLVWFVYILISLFILGSMLLDIPL